MAATTPAPAPPTLAAVIDRCRAWVRSQARAKKRIAHEAGLAQNTLARCEAPTWRPSTSTIEALERLIPPDWPPPAGP